MASASSETRRGPYNLRSGTSKQQPKPSGDVEKKRKSVMVAEPQPKPKKMINKPKSKEPEKDYDEMTEDEKFAYCKKITNRIFGGHPPNREPTKKGLQECRAQCVKLSKFALSVYNSSQPGPESPQYKLVRGIDYEIIFLSMRMVYHINFEARIKTIPDAPVELFFAEIQAANERTVNRCDKLGLADDPDIEVFKGICKCTDIKHPADGKFLTGRA